MPKTYISYEESPLATFITKAIDTITTIKATYADDLARHDTLENQAAQNLVNLVDVALHVLHKTVLPKFSHGQAPGVRAFSEFFTASQRLRPFVYALQNRENVLITTLRNETPKIVAAARLKKDRDDNDLIASIIRIIEINKTTLYKEAAKIPGPELDVLLNELTQKLRRLNLGDDTQHLTDEYVISRISTHLELEMYVPKHPIVYELMEMMAELAKVAPAELASLIPFFNPQASIKFLNSGMVGTILKTLGGFRIKQLESKGNEAPYTFEISVKDSVFPIDAAQAYSQTREAFISNKLEPALRRYLALYDATHSANDKAQAAIEKGKVRVESELARTAILQHFTTLTLETINESILAHRKPWSCPFEIDPELPQIHSIIHKIEYNQRFMTSIREFRYDLLSKSQRYASLPLGDLLRDLNDPNILNECVAHKEKGLDVGYWQHPLPETIVLVTDGPCATRDKTIGVRDHINWLITQQLNDLQTHEDMRQEQTDALSELLITLWGEECSSHIQTIQELERQLREMPVFNTAHLEEDVHHLERASEHLLTTAEAQIALKQRVMIVLQTVQQPMPSISDEWLREELKKVTRAVWNAVETFTEAFTRSQQAINAKQEIVQTKLEKITSAIRFSEQLLSANVPQLQQLWDEKTQQLASLQAEKSTQEASLLTLQTTIASQHAVHENLLLQEQLKYEERTAHQLDFTTLHPELDLSSSVTQKNIDDALNILGVLCSVRSALEEAQNTHKIPFRVLCSIISIEELLQLLNCTIPLKAYQTHQESSKIFKPSKKEFFKMYNALTSAINTKTLEIDKFLLIAPDIIRHSVQQQAFASEFGVIQAELNALRLDLQQRQAEAEDRTRTINALTHEILPLKNAQLILTQFIDILTEINQFKPLLELFAENADARELPQQILNLRATEDRLLAKTAEAANALQLFTAQENYQPTLTIIQQLLDQIHQRISVIIGEKTTPRLPVISVMDVEEEVLLPEEDTTLTTTARRQAMAQQLIAALTNYRIKRDQHYKIKDFFTSSDKMLRQESIQQLEVELQSYAESGDNSRLLELIQEKQFPGKNLQPLLHKITADVLEFDEEITTNSQSVDEILDALNKNNPEYVQALKRLYQRISSMQRYGEEHASKTAMELADKLQQTANNFVMYHGTALPSLASYQAFTKKFTARLHSEDNVMSQEGKNWTHIVANIALALLLIPKLIYSKLTTGRCSFFFEETKATGIISAIEESAHELPRPAA